MLKILNTIKTKMAVMAIAVSALTLAFTFTAGSAQAASTNAAADWEYAGSFYWRESCDEAGQAGIPRAWSDYYCDGSGWPWDDYDLYVLYN